MERRIVPAIAVRLSGLSARSAGNGRNRATVVHWMAQAPVTLGRVHRKPWQFLCRAWAPWDVSVREDVAVTCERCVEIASRAALSAPSGSAVPTTEEGRDDATTSDSRD